MVRSSFLFLYLTISLYTSSTFWTNDFKKFKRTYLVVTSTLCKRLLFIAFLYASLSFLSIKKYQSRTMIDAFETKSGDVVDVFIVSFKKPEQKIVDVIVCQEVRMVSTLCVLDWR